MGDLAIGKRNKTDDLSASRPTQPVPLWQSPFSLRKVIAWTPEFLSPWNAFHLATSILWVTLLIPS